MAYDKVAMQEIGGKLVDLVLALADGVGVEDLEEGVAFLSAAATQGSSIAADPDAAIADILAGAASAFADLKRDPQPV
jgi:hypothetical protein